MIRKVNPASTACIRGTRIHERGGDGTWNDAPQPLGDRLLREVLRQQKLARIEQYSGEPASVRLAAEITDGGGVHVTVRLVDPAVDRKVRVESISRNRAELQALARRIAAAASVAALERRAAR